MEEKDVADIDQAYVDQMKLWFKEQLMLGDQIQRTITHYEQMADINRLELVLNNKRIEIVAIEYNIWAEEKGLPKWEG